MQKSYSKDNSRLFFILHSIMDMLLVCLGFNTVISIYSFSHSQTVLSHLLELNILFALASLILFKVYTVVRCGRKSYMETVLSAAISLVFIDIAAALLSVIFIKGQVPLSIFLSTFLFQIIYIMIWKGIVYKLYPILYKVKTVVFIGSGNEVYDQVKKILAKDKNMFKVKYICEFVSNDTYKMIEAVDVVFISPNLEGFYKDSIINYAIGHGKTVYLVPELYEIAIYNAQMARFDDVPTFRIDNINQSGEQVIVKRLFDIIVSLIGIIVTLPVMIAVFLLIKINDGGPAFFSQERVTKWNKKFKLYKFRSMVVDAEKHTGPTLATDNDSRVTRIGRILRATRLDELPQFFNVLFGDMSIVGPRPERQFFIEQFKETVPNFELRYTVNAGITGLAHVLGKYATTTEDRLRFDLLYITHGFSLLMDLKIILQTIRIMFMKAYSKGVKKGEEEIPEFIKQEFNSVLHKN